MLIAHKFKMDAVHNKTSDIVQMSHSIEPKPHLIVDLEQKIK